MADIYKFDYIKNNIGDFPVLSMDHEISQEDRDKIDKENREKYLKTLDSFTDDHVKEILNAAQQKLDEQLASPSDQKNHIIIELLQYTIKSCNNILNNDTTIYHHTTPNEVKKAIFEQSNKEKNKKYRRINRCLALFELYRDYFNPKKTSKAADKISERINFFAKWAPNASVDKLPLFSFSGFYRPDGRVRVASELQRIRTSMVKMAKLLQKKYGNDVRSYINELETSEQENVDSKAENKRSKVAINAIIKKLNDFFTITDDLEIKNSFREETATSLGTYDIKASHELNKQPDDLISRIAIRDCTLEIKNADNNVVISAIQSNPKHYLTYALNGSLCDPKILKEAKDWFKFTSSVFGSEGALRFYEFVGYLLVTRYPQPTERNLMIIVGNPGTGKGTHMAAVESLLSFENTTLFAKAGPHQLSDPNLHFSTQNLDNKLALLNGDLPHKRIPDFSPVNDLFGGEPFESNKKYLAPTNEIPIFKGIWAGTYPLFSITKPGGAWRRIMLLNTYPIPASQRNTELKARLLNENNGFLYNGIIGLCYLIKNNWKFTNEMSDNEVEKLWADYSDSILIWAQSRLIPEDAETDKRTTERGVDGVHTKIEKVDNTDKMLVIDWLYGAYEKWAKDKQIEPAKPKTFSAWLGRNGFTIKRKVIQNGDYMGVKKYVVFASYNDSGEDVKGMNDASTVNISFNDFILGSKAHFDIQINCQCMNGLLNIKKEDPENAIQEHIEDVPEPDNTETLMESGNKELITQFTQETTIVKVRLLMDQPEGIADLNRDIGPCSAGDIVELSKSSADILIRHNGAELVTDDPVKKDPPVKYPKSEQNIITKSNGEQLQASLKDKYLIRFHGQYKADFRFTDKTYRIGITKDRDLMPLIEQMAKNNWFYIDNPETVYFIKYLTANKNNSSNKNRPYFELAKEIKSKPISNHEFVDKVWHYLVEKEQFKLHSVPSVAAGSKKYRIEIIASGKEFTRLSEIVNEIQNTLGPYYGISMDSPGNRTIEINFEVPK